MGWVYRIGILLASEISFFLSLWIVLPAPYFWLLPLGVGAPEVSPWLFLANAIALGFAWFVSPRDWMINLAIVSVAIGAGLSLLPLVQVPATSAKLAMELRAELGEDYDKSFAALSGKLRSAPFLLLDVFRGIAPPLPPGAINIQRGIVFAEPEGVSLQLNVYRPAAAGLYPAIALIYGGAWRTGSPDDYEAFSQYFAGQGYTVIGLDYRHAPAHRYPAQQTDIAAGLAYIQAHAQALSVDINRVAVMGRSAGAQLATIAAYQADAFPFRAVVNYYGPVDLARGYEEPPIPDPINSRHVLTQFLGGPPTELPDLYRQASPIHFVRPSLPPTLLVYAGRDNLVQAKFGRQLRDRLRDSGNQVVWVEIPWAEHAFDAVFRGVSNQVALYYTERFLAWALQPEVARSPQPVP